ncbi:MAG: hypothetical protein NT086_20440 [Proteobacteria bacterium]|nr:hypothetical protein [Pseudomonadota bacterium]
MAIPLVILGIIEIVSAAITAYEMYDLIDEFYDGLKNYNKGIDKAKEELKNQIEALKADIDEKISEKREVSILLTAANADPQGQNTKVAKGRAAGSPVINAAIQQKIPFRQVISMVCTQADKIPVLQLRKKKGVELKDLPKAKRVAFEKLLALSAEELVGVDLESFIVVRLKQLASNLMFEFIDEVLAWSSPLKCEVCFGPAPAYADHPLSGVSPTRLRRDGDINPFYPMPYRRGSISADLVITEYRKKRCDKNNIFAIVEIKFQNDTIDEEQFKKYRALLKAAALVKNANSPIKFDKNNVNSGGRLALFRFPEDVVVKDDSKDKKDPKDQSDQPRKQSPRTGRRSGH